MKKKLRTFLGWTNNYPAGFYLCDLLFRKILRQNAGTTWPVHFTSTLIYPERIVRGKNVYPGDSPANYIQAINGIKIGDHTNIGPHVSIISANHDTRDNSRHIECGPVEIGNRCWIGSHAVILPGVILGDHTIVAAGAIVNKSFPIGHCVLAGNPAIIVKELSISE